MVRYNCMNFWANNIIIKLILLTLGLVNTSFSQTYENSFEGGVPDNHSIGAFSDQSWEVKGQAEVIDTEAANGTQSVELSPVTGEASLNYIGSITNNVVFVSYYQKPRVREVEELPSEFDPGLVALTGFVHLSSDGEVYVVDGAAIGGPQWLATGERFPLVSNQSADWIEFTYRLDYTSKTWDLYIDGQLVVVNLGFIDHAVSQFTQFHIRGDDTDSVLIDDYYVSDINPLFLDSDADGMDDVYEEAHGLNPAVDDRLGDLDGDGLYNIEELLKGTDPSIRDVVRYEAEDAQFYRSTYNTDKSGWSGTGYVNLKKNAEAYIEWSIYSPIKGYAKLIFGYADKAKRPLEIQINGSEIMSAFEFAKTGGTGVWKESPAITVELKQGTNTVRITTLGQNGGNFDYLDVLGFDADGIIAIEQVSNPIDPSLTESNRYEAEDAEVVGAKVKITSQKNSGRGFVDYRNAAGDSIEWAVDVSHTGEAQLIFGYAFGKGSRKDRPLEIWVNDEIVAISLSFRGTGDWQNWETTVPLTVHLNEGVNTVRATTIGYNGANLDYLDVVTYIHSDADGYSDYEETEIHHSDPYLDDLNETELIASYTGGQASVSSGEWEQDGDALYVTSINGTLSYDVEITEAGVYLLEYEVSYKANPLPNDSYLVDLFVDGIFVNRVHVVLVEGKNALIKVATPWLTAGPHQVSLFYDNTKSHRSIQINAFHLKRIAGEE